MPTDGTMLPTRHSGNFGTFPFFRQLADDLLLAHIY
jgi:hypothetical protein